MSVELTFRDVSYPGFFEHFSCDIHAGCSVLIVTSGDAENNVLSRLFTGLTHPSSGSVWLNRQEITSLDSDQLYDLRQHVGIVPANGGLVSNLKIWENITLPLIYHAGGVTAEEQEAAGTYLAELGYTGTTMALPAHLSLPEKRIVALVRTWLSQPSIAVYSNCFEDLPPEQLGTFARLAAKFQASRSNRISIYLAASAQMATVLAIDTIIQVHEAPH